LGFSSRINDLMKSLVVLPAFNEEVSIARVLAGLALLPEDLFEVLVVDDGSTDNTSQIVTECRPPRLRCHLVRLAVNSGIGAAVQTGYQFAVLSGRYHYVIQFDADGQHDPEAIEELVEACERDDLDLCIGSRFLDASGFQSTRLRRLGIRTLVALIRCLTRRNITDPTSGLRCAGPRVWPYFARHYPEDYPEPESLFWCLRNGLRVGEISVRMFPRQAGSSSIPNHAGAYYMAKVTMSILIDLIRRKEVFSR
jgi:glycosyltransferase involved in cell wall biosynthesis